MKKIVLMSFISLLLSACGEKNDKVTEKMLVGSWVCQTTEYYNADSDEPNEIPNRIYTEQVIYTLQQGHLYKKNDQGEATLFDINEFYASPISKFEGDFTDILRENRVEKISNFKIRWISTAQYNAKDGTRFDSRNETICNKTAK